MKQEGICPDRLPERAWFLSGLLCVSVCLAPDQSGAGRLELELADLDGINGYVLHGVNPGDESGYPISGAGDVNDDGIDDLVVGAFHADPNGKNSGASYVVFGTAGPTSALLELSSLDGSNGYVVNGVTADDEAGGAVSNAGDLNGDGIDDLIIAAENAGTDFYAGASYVLFGGAGLGSSGAVELSTVDGSNGFIVNGASGRTQETATGISVSSAGDVNGDGNDDLIIGALHADPNDDESGASYIVFGGPHLAGPGTLELSALDGTDGFVVNGEGPDNRSGVAVASLGDFNGDGIDDLVIGAPFAEPAGIRYAGAAYVLYGGTGVGGSGVLELSSLDGTNGFVLMGAGVDFLTGYSAAGAGDINNDGFSDLVLGAHRADPAGLNSGAAFVVFGGAGVAESGSLGLWTLDGSNGFIVAGATPNDLAGVAVSSAGDFNDDGTDDLLVGAYLADAHGAESGAGYVVFGRNDIGSSGLLRLSTLGDTDGLTVLGDANGDSTGISVGSAGDLNGDAISDIVIGAFGADPNGTDAGAAYVVFGGAGNKGELNVSALDGTNGFALNGAAAGDRTGCSANSAGDVNGDGIGDLVVGAIGADPNGDGSGASYVVFGGSGVGAGGLIELALLDGSEGFVVNGVQSGDDSGTSVSTARDLNGDGIDDLVIGASGAEPNGEDSGAAYVVFGSVGLGSSGAVELAALDGSSGLVLNGELSLEERHPRGIAVSALGDVNADGFDDAIVGDPRAVPDGIWDAGSSYVVFGGPFVGSGGTIEAGDFDGSNGFILNGIQPGDRAGFAVGGAGDINGDGVDDIVIGAALADPNGLSLAGTSYVVFGAPLLGSGGALELASLDGSNGFTINGAAADDRSGLSVSGVGDVNQDGLDDLLIGAYRASATGPRSGASYVVFGAPGVGSSGTLELASLNGPNGFVINGVAAGDLSGLSVSGPGDVSGDGIDDLLIGAKWADPNGTSDAGAAYVIYGEPGLGSAGSFELGSLDGTNGLVLNGIAPGDRAGRWVSGAGDLNSDGIGDLLIGAYAADPGGRSEAGASYVVYGRPPGPGATLTNVAGTRVICLNLDRPSNVIFASAKSAWDCGWKGLEYAPGERVVMLFEGTATGSAQVGGKAIGLAGRPMLTRCENVTTGQVVLSPRSGLDPWDCRTDGLTINPGDSVRLLLLGYLP